MKQFRYLNVNAQKQSEDKFNLTGILQVMSR